MDSELDLTTASRETLLAIIAQLQQRVAALEARLNPRGSTGMPGIKSSSTRCTSRKATRQCRPHGFARVRMAPTQRVDMRWRCAPTVVLT
jgi:hypothetical protein